MLNNLNLRMKPQFGESYGVLIGVTETKCTYEGWGSVSIAGTWGKNYFNKRAHKIESTNDSFVQMRRFRIS